MSQMSIEEERRKAKVSDYNGQYIHLKQTIDQILKSSKLDHIYIYLYIYIHSSISGESAKVSDYNGQYIRLNQL